jgi:hypothetical protein
MLTGVDAFVMTDGVVNTVNFFYSGGLISGLSTNHAWAVRTNNVDRLIIAAAGGVTINDPASGASLAFGQAATRMVPGATSFSLRNTANSADNLILLDAGAATFRTTVKALALDNDNTSASALGFMGIPQNSQSTGYTFVAADAGKHVLHPSADTTARTFTIPANSSVAYPIGTVLTVINQNAAGVITIAITTDTMRLAASGTTGSRTLAANGLATATKLTATEWIISGVALT